MGPNAYDKINANYIYLNFPGENKLNGRIISGLFGETDTFRTAAMPVRASKLVGRTDDW